MIAQRLTELVQAWQQADALDVSVVIMAALSLAIIVAHAVVKRAIDHREDWTEEGNVRPRW